MIELLVVVAIIAILAAILLPSLQQAKEKSKRAACMQNMRQVAVALQMLASDNDGWINGINAATDTNGTAMAIDWTVSVASYLGRGNTNYLGQYKQLSYTESTTLCPSRLPSHPDSNSGTGFADGWYPYGANTLFVGYQYYPMHKLTEVVHSERVYLLSDCYTGWPESLNNLVHQAIWTIDGGWGSGIWMHARHPARPGLTPGVPFIGNGLNFVYVDGHGEFLKRYGLNWYEVDWYKTYGQASQWKLAGSATLSTGGYGISGE